MTTLVAARRVVLGYGTRVAVAASTFTIPRGSLTAVVGPNGSGKSTLLNALAGLTAPIDGTLDYPSGLPQVAYVLQTTKVNEALPVTVREIVTMGRYPSTGSYGWIRGHDRGIVDAAMERMGLTNLADRHLSELSGGQRQRVFVAQGLAQDHDLLLLDEPLTGLDLPSAQAIDEVVHAEPGGATTVVLTTHDLEEARTADHVLLLAGRVVASGPPDDVLTSEHLAAAYGPSLLHLDGAEVFIDDPAHTPAGERHVHRDRTIHVESAVTERHAEE